MGNHLIHLNFDGKLPEFIFNLFEERLSDAHKKTNFKDKKDFIGRLLGSKYRHINGEVQVYFRLDTQQEKEYFTGCLKSVINESRNHLGGPKSWEHEELLECLKNWFYIGIFQKLDPGMPVSPKEKRLALARKKGVMSKYVDEAVEIAFKYLMMPESPVQLNERAKRELQCKVDWSLGRSSSRGGVNSKGQPHMSFALAHFSHHALDSNTVEFLEYKSLRKYKDIGSCKGTLRAVIYALVAHEMSHVAQFCWRLQANRYCEKSTLSEVQLLKPHGEGWQTIYRFLRVYWINRMDDYQWKEHTPLPKNRS